MILNFFWFLVILIVCTGTTVVMIREFVQHFRLEPVIWPKEPKRTEGMSQADWKRVWAAHSRKSGWAMLASAVLGIGMGIFVVVCVYSGWYSLISHTVMRNGRIASAQAAHGMVCISWMGRSCANISAPSSNTIASHVTPITDNPKARPITYCVVARISDSARYVNTYGLDHDSDENEQLITNAVRYQLYELNNASSRDLARFYNPLDQAQVKGFEQLVTAYVNPRLASKGIRISLLKFKIDEPQFGTYDPCAT